MDDKSKNAAQNEANRSPAPERSDSEKDKQQKKDTGRIDQREGEMNNGELGGNLGQRREDQ